MSHATKCPQRHSHTERELAVHRRGRSATHALRVEVRREALTQERENGLTRIAALQRLEHVHRKLKAVRRLHERRVADQLDPLC